MVMLRCIEMVQKQSRTAQRCVKVRLVLSPYISLRETHDCPCLTSGPTACIGVALVCDPFLDSSGLLIEVDDVAGAVVLSNVRLHCGKSVTCSYVCQALVLNQL